MALTGVINGYYAFSLWVVRLFALNCLWIGFTLFGFGVFGLMPATVAMFSVTRKWVTAQKEMVPIYHTFWTTYKKSFVQTNMYGLLFFLVGYLLITEFRIAQAGSGTAYTAAMFATLGIMLIFAIIMLYFFPIYVHFHLSYIDYVKWPLLISIIHPVLTVFLLVSLGCTFYFIYTTVPILIVLFGGSGAAYLIMWAVSQTFFLYYRKV